MLKRNAENHMIENVENKVGYNAEFKKYSILSIYY